MLKIIFLIWQKNAIATSLILMIDNLAFPAIQTGHISTIHQSSAKTVSKDSFLIPLHHNA